MSQLALMQAGIYSPSPFCMALFENRDQRSESHRQTLILTLYTSLHSIILIPASRFAALLGVVTNCIKTGRTYRNGQNGSAEKVCDRT